MTELRYLPNADDVLTFSDTVVEATPESIVLEGTYFYPEGGGQPADHGRLSWDEGTARVVDVRKDHGDVRHYIDDLEGEPPESGTPIRGEIDETRRRKLSRMHTAQHVVSRVVLDEYGASTAGNQIHPDRSRIDFKPVTLDDDRVETVEALSNEAIDRDLPVTKHNEPREKAEDRVDEGRALLDLIPDHVDPLRVVEIEKFDVCPCGGTHVDRLGEIGEITITERTSKGADTDRIEFELSGP